VAFDLVKLQMLQEALHIVKYITRDIVICSNLSRAISIYFNCPSCGTKEVDEFLPEITAIINTSLEVRKNCLILDPFATDPVSVQAYRQIGRASQLMHLAISVGYIWPNSYEYRHDRIKYLERLIEDEMSGTYFIGGSNGL